MDSPPLTPTEGQMKMDDSARDLKDAHHEVAIWDPENDYLSPCAPDTSTPMANALPHLQNFAISVVSVYNIPSTKDVDLNERFPVAAFDVPSLSSSSSSIASFEAPSEPSQQSPTSDDSISDMVDISGENEILEQPIPAVDVPATLEVKQSPSTVTIAEPTIILPDLFVSFISEKPILHPAYEQVRKDSEDFFLETMKWSDQQHKRHCRGDFAYFAAIFCTEADTDDFRVIADWCNWVLTDQTKLTPEFDEDGPLRGNYDDAKKELESIYSVMSPEPFPHDKDEYPLRYIIHYVWNYVAKRGSQSTARRFREASAKYYHGVLQQVITDHTYRAVDDETFLRERRESIGVYPVLHLIAFWRRLDLPDFVFDNEAIQEIEHVVADIVVLQNEILSYQKEYFNGDDRNIVARFRKSGLSQQQAYDQVDSLLKACYRRWYILQSEIPCWGEHIDAQVQGYLKGCKDLCIANLDWSYKTQRYFGRQNDDVRRTRRVAYLP